jgi:hypothetical protein
MCLGLACRLYTCSILVYTYLGGAPLSLGPSAAALLDPPPGPGLHRPDYNNKNSGAKQGLMGRRRRGQPDEETAPSVGCRRDDRAIVAYHTERPKDM